MSAELSPDGLYRYTLKRDLATLHGEGTVLFVMLNPSTADAVEDDPTIRRCISYARDWGFATLLVGNAYAMRATDPLLLEEAPDPVGPLNNQRLAELAAEADTVVIAWGTAIGPEREREVLGILHRAHGDDLKCLGQTQSLRPAHPLYLARRAPLVRYRHYP